MLLSLRPLASSRWAACDDSAPSVECIAACLYSCPPYYSAQIVYHVYQMGAPDAGIRIGAPSIGWKKLIKPTILFLLFAVWVVYLAGVSYVSNYLM